MKKLAGIVTLLFLVGCSDAIEEVTFVEITDVQLENLSSDTIILVGECVLYNPNPIPLELTDADFTVYINDRKAALISQDTLINMPARSEFNLKLRATLSPQELYGDRGSGLLEAAITVLARQRVDVRYDGSIKAGKGFARFTVPVKDSLSVPVKMKF